jgi:Sulfotransferase domain
VTEGLQVIGAGFGRTGTMSLKDALQELGFDPCYHMIETFERPDKCALWLQAEQGDQVDWRKLLAGYRATVDWPGCRFYRQLMGVFPEAKVILTTRDPDSWYDSVNATIHTRPAAQEPRPQDDLRTQMVRAVVWDGSLEGKYDDRAAAIGIFYRHIEDVRQYVPTDRLLVFDVREGWQPLCDFLGVDAPRTPFPHLNEAKVFTDPEAFGEMVAEMRSEMQ